MLCYLFCLLFWEQFTINFACLDANKNPNIVSKNILKLAMQAKTYGHCIEHVPRLNWFAWLPQTDRTILTFHPIGKIVIPNNSETAIWKIIYHSEYDLKSSKRF